MKTILVSLPRLQEIARLRGAMLAVDVTRGVAFVRIAQTKYVAPLPEDAAA